MAVPVRWRHVGRPAPARLPRRLRRSDRTTRVPGPRGFGLRNRRCGRARNSGHRIRTPRPTECGRAPRLQTEPAPGAALFADRAAHGGPPRSSCRSADVTWRNLAQCSLRGKSGGATIVRSDLEEEPHMPEFTVNPTRVDPYKNFKFRVKWDGKYVAGVNKISGLKRTTEVVQHREGGDPSTSHKSPGRTQYEAITLERGLTHDTAFEDWANKVWKLGAGPGAEVALADFRKEIIIDF